MTPLTKPVEITFVARPMSEAPKGRDVAVFYEGRWRKGRKFVDMRGDSAWRFVGRITDCYSWEEIQPLAWAELADMVPALESLEQGKGAGE